MLEKKARNNLEDTGTGKDFLNRASLAQALRSTVNKWDLIKLKSFCKAENTTIWAKQQPTE